MEFNKQTVKALLGVVCGGIAFAAALLHLEYRHGKSFAFQIVIPTDCHHADAGALPVSPCKKSQ